ncbi:hypothetical protein K2173_003712 [Erythroxylum novogranatense]|uniref:Uncharacterized protein n=1 Tax=Erythroxylum novogranatense TaxID=1862640 RepID=A0AAV8TB13_9ROSI|nr:hypothetical protein K2173_003712 [Erythroxylum novogranatense]
MGCSSCKNRSDINEKGTRALAGKVMVLEEEMKGVMREKEKESKGYETDMVAFAFKEAEWKQERKRFKEEVKRLRKMLEEKEEKIKGMKDGKLYGSNNGYEFLVEQMREESALWRDETVEKWKRLYLAIKNELDDLIQKTHRGDGLYWRAEEEQMIEELKVELEAKERTIEDLKAQLAFAEKEGFKRARELDLLRQSLRITSTARKPPSFVLGKSKLVFGKQPKKAYGV